MKSEEANVHQLKHLSISPPRFKNHRPKSSFLQTQRKSSLFKEEVFNHQVTEK